MTEFTTYLIFSNTKPYIKRTEGDDQGGYQASCSDDTNRSTAPQLHKPTDPQTQHLSLWLFEHWSCAISFTTHVSTILENPPFRTDEERNDNSRYRISQALFSLTSSKTPLSLPRFPYQPHTSQLHSLTSSPFKNTPAYPDFYLVSTSIPNPIPSHRSRGNPPMHWSPAVF